MSITHPYHLLLPTSQWKSRISVSLKHHLTGLWSLCIKGKKGKKINHKQHKQQQKRPNTTIRNKHQEDIIWLNRMIFRDKFISDNQLYFFLSPCTAHLSIYTNISFFIFPFKEPTGVFVFVYTTCQHAIAKRQYKVPIKTWKSLGKQSQGFCLFTFSIIFSWKIQTQWSFLDQVKYLYINIHTWYQFRLDCL